MLLRMVVACQFPEQTWAIWQLSNLEGVYCFCFVCVLYDDLCVCFGLLGADLEMLWKVGSCVSICYGALISCYL